MTTSKENTRTEALIKDYLYRNTDYAIMLTAPWGSGKTHFLKHTIFNNLGETDYKGIIVSLFGVNSIDGIKERILIELYPLLDNKIVKAGMLAVSGLAKIVDIGKLITPAGWVTPVSLEKVDSGKMKKAAVGLVNLKKLLICFDDLERVRPDMLTSNEILGYINSLVEEDNIKVIIVANQDKIGDVKFKDIKEKVIGNTIHFTQDFDLAFESIVSEVGYPTEKFKDYVIANKALIKEMLEKDNGGQVNYRTLKYFLSHYKNVAHYIQSIRDKAIIAIKEDLLKKVMDFCIIICIEFKIGQISYGANGGLDDLSNAMARIMLDDKTAKNYTDQVVDKYLEGDYGRYHYYPNLFDFLTGGNVFSERELYNEIIKQYNIVDNNLGEEYVVLRSLSYHEVRELNDDVYIEQTRKLLKFLYAGNYHLQDFLTIFYYLTRFGNPLRLSREKLKRKMISLLRKNARRYNYQPMLAQYTSVDENSPNHEFYLPIREVMLEVNRKNAEKDQKLVDENISMLFQKDFDGCFRYFTSEIAPSLSKHSLSGIKPTTFFNVFKTQSNANKYRIGILISIVYDVGRGNYRLNDIAFLRSLKSNVEDHLSKFKPKNVSGDLMSGFLKFIDAAIEKISPYTVNYADQ